MRSPIITVARARRRRRLRREAKTLDPAPFVIGAARSGTTMLRLMLDAHPQLALPPETQFVPELIDASKQPGANAASLAELLVSHRRFGDFGLDPDEIRRRFASLESFSAAGAIRAFYVAYAEKEGKPRWGDKTPGYSWRMRLIDRHLAEARFVHLIRDGRDVRLSQLGRGAEHPPAGRHARRWRKRVTAARRQGRRVRHYMEVRYEDLVLDTEVQLRRICDFVDLDYDPAMLSFHERATERLQEIDRELPEGQELFADRQRKPRTAEERMALHRLTTEPPRADRVARWRTQMPADDRAEFERVAGDLLSALGYEVGAAPEPPPPGTPARATPG